MWRLAVHMKESEFAVNVVRFDLAGIVRNIEQGLEFSMGIHLHECAAHQVSKDLAIGKRTVHSSVHRADILLAFR